MAARMVTESFHQVSNRLRDGHQLRLGGLRMKYLCLCYYDLDAFKKLQASQYAEIRDACKPHDTALRATGKIVAQASLTAPESWSYFTPKEGKPIAGNGFYLKSKDQAGAFFIIDASSDEEARDVASKHAAANCGEHLGFAVEVRACETYEEYECRT